MRIKTITATYSQKFNLGNYEACELSAFMAADVDEDDDNIEAAIQLLYIMAKEAVWAEAQKVVKLHDVYNPSITYYVRNKKVEERTKQAEKEYDYVSKEEYNEPIPEDPDW